MKLSIRKMIYSIMFAILAVAGCSKTDMRSPKSVKLTLSNISHELSSGAHTVNAVVDTSSGRKFKLHSTYLESGMQTHAITDEQGTGFYQLIVSELGFTAEEFIGGILSRRDFAVGGAGNFFGILNDYQPTDKDQEDAQVAFSDHALYKLMIVALENLNTPALKTPLDQLKRAVVLQIAGNPRKNVETPQGEPNPSLHDEWSSFYQYTEKVGKAGYVSPPIYYASSFVPGMRYILLFPEANTTPAPDKEPACPVEDDEESTVANLDLPIPGIGEIKINAISASVHAKCLTEDCISGGSEGAVNITPFADVPICTEIFKNGAVHMTANATGQGKVNIKKADCLFESDDYAQIAGIEFKPAAAPAITANANVAEGNFACAAAAARISFNGCVGTRAGHTLPMPLLFNTSVSKLTTDCSDPAIPPATGGN